MGNQVRILRQRNRLTQKQLAFRCGVKQSTISRIENNDYIPSTNLIYRLAYSLKVCPTLILNLFICKKCPFSRICNHDIRNPYINFNLLKH